MLRFASATVRDDTDACEDKNAFYIFNYIADSDVNGIDGQSMSYFCHANDDSFQNHYSCQ